MGPRAKCAYGGFGFTLEILVSVLLAFGTPFGFSVNLDRLIMFILNDHGVNIGRTVNDGRPGFIIRGAHDTAFGYPWVLSKVIWGQFPVKPSNGEFLGVQIVTAYHVESDSVFWSAIS